MTEAEREAREVLMAVAGRADGSRAEEPYEVLRLVETAYVSLITPDADADGEIG